MRYGNGNFTLLTGTWQWNLEVTVMSMAHKNGNLSLAHNCMTHGNGKLSHTAMDRTYMTVETLMW